MSASRSEPDPSAIGGIPKGQFALLPKAGVVFQERADRLETLARHSRLAPYLEFLGTIARIQHEMASALPQPAAIPADQSERARANAMPPVDRDAMARSPECRRALHDFLERAAALAMPPAAAEALAQVRAADEASLSWMIGNVLAGELPGDSLAHHLYVAAAIQVEATRLAATLDSSRLVPIQVGVCPACGGKPVGSMVIGIHGVEGTRYACCSSCATMWNEVRVKCLACGATKGVGYRAVETGGEEATVKAEVCDSCHGWTKVLYQNRNPSLEIVADDVASLGLDLLMKDTEYKRSGFDPFLIGY